MALGVDGLVSGLDTTSIISGLMAVEARPQTLLKNQLTQAQAKATAYRAVNTRFDAIRTAAEALTSSALQATKTASSSSTSVAASATSAATKGTVTFEVVQTAATQEVVSGRVFTSTSTSVTDDGVRPSWPIQVLDADGNVTDTITVPAGATLSDVADLISASGYGLDAAVIQVGRGEFRLKITSQTAGSDGAFRIGLTAGDGSVDEAAFTEVSAARGAVLDLGNGVLVTSPSNTFPDLIPGTSITVSKREQDVTVRVGSDDAAITAKVQALVDAANGALGLIKGYTTSTAGQATATLQGDRALVQLSDQVLDAVSSAIGGKSASSIGLQLTRDGKITFDAAVFSTALGNDRTATTALLSGTGTTTGIAGTLAALAKTASDSSTGTLVQLATGRDTLAKAIQDKVDAFDVRLEARKATLTAQFTALERSLNTIKNQSSWLSQQIGQLYNPNAS